MKQQKFGVTKNGEEITLITLENKNGTKAVVTDMGASLVSLWVKDKNGKLLDVVTGFGTLAEYEENDPNFGATIGRNGNRISGPAITINGKTYPLAETAPCVNLHSGPDGYKKRKWNFETETEDVDTITFFINSPDGDQGFPGSCDVEVTYTLTEEDELMIQYYGLSDKDTIFNMTNHTYFNMNGHDSGDVLNHTVYLYADQFMPTDERLLPTGELRSVEGTPFDFREGQKIGEHIRDDEPNLKIGKGYDHNFIVNNGEKKEDAELIGKFIGDKSGITMEIYSDLPGVQFYSACQTDYRNGKGGTHYQQYCAACFETQYAPDAINLPESGLLAPIIKAGEELVSLTVYRFTTEE